MPSTSRVLLPALALLAAGRVAQAQLPAPPAPPENPITPEKAVLGKVLFWDEQLSSDNTVACGTCHRPASGGADPRTGSAESRHPGPDGVLGNQDDVFGTLGVLLADANDDYAEEPTFGFEPQVTTRQSPSFIGAQFFDELFWEGRASSTFRDPVTNAVVIPSGGALESQAAGPPVSEVEMAHQERDWGQITAKLQVARPLALASDLTPDLVTALANDPTYPELFESAFGTTEVTATRIAFALATYQRTLIPDQTPFDLGTLTPQQQQGFNAFAGPSNCVICHTPPLFTDGGFRNVGLRPPAEDRGRQEVTGNPGDRGRFKVPSLRNVGLRNTFFHTGHVRPGGGAPLNSLGAVLAFYDRGGDFPDNLDPLLATGNTRVPPPVRPAMLDFLENGLTDPRVRDELFPFDRPRLSSEEPATSPTLVGSGVAGSGGAVPRALASAPPLVGTPGFKIGVASGLGGAVAHLMWVDSPNQGGPVRGSTPQFGFTRRTPLATVVLEGSGPGEGFGTAHLDLGDLPVTRWPEMTLQWWIQDPGARSGYAKSERIELTALF